MLDAVMPMSLHFNTNIVHENKRRIFYEQS